MSYFELALEGEILARRGFGEFDRGMTRQEFGGGMTRLCGDDYGGGDRGRRISWSKMVGCFVTVHGLYSTFQIGVEIYAGRSHGAFTPYLWLILICKSPVKKVSSISFLR